MFVVGLQVIAVPASVVATHPPASAQAPDVVSQTTNLNVALRGPATAVWHDRAYVIGGTGSYTQADAYRADVWAYDDATAQLTTIAVLPEAIAYAAAASDHTTATTTTTTTTTNETNETKATNATDATDATNAGSSEGAGAIFVFGGLTARDVASTAIWRIDPSSGDVTTMPDVLPRALYGHAAVWDGARFVIYGGYDLANGAFSRDIYYYHPAIGMVDAPFDLPADAANVAAVMVGDEAILVGLQGATTAWRHRAGSHKLLPLDGDLPSPDGRGVALASDGVSAYFVGGRRCDGPRTFCDTVWRYHAGLDKWALAPARLPAPLSDAGAAWLNGGLVVIGGAHADPDDPAGQAANTLTRLAWTLQPPDPQMVSTLDRLTLRVDASATQAPDRLLPANYTWSWGDGQSTTQAGGIASHTYASEMAATVRLTVIDEDGGAHSHEESLVIALAPVADFDWQDRGALVARLDASWSQDLGPLRYRWDFGDGTSSALGAIVDHRYPTAGPYMVKLTTTDAFGLAASQVRQVRLDPTASPSAVEPTPPATSGPTPQPTSETAPPPDSSTPSTDSSTQLVSAEPIAPATGLPPPSDRLADEPGVDAGGGPADPPATGASGTNQPQSDETNGIIYAGVADPNAAFQRPAKIAAGIMLAIGIAAIITHRLHKG